jgi:ribose/xylose/arabinose/galactoside ABC-type transport system permease subunit
VSQVAKFINGKHWTNKKRPKMDFRKIQLLMLERLMWIIAIACYMLFIFLSPDLFFTPSRVIDIFKMYAGHGILAIAVGIGLISGCMDLSLPAIGGLTGVFIVEFSEVWFPNTPGIFLLLLPLIVGAAMGAFNGLISGRMGVHPFFVTLATSLLFQGSRKLIRPGSLWIKHNDILLLPSAEVVGEITFSIVILLVIIAFIWVLLNYTHIGVRMYAVGGNAASARMMGINVKNMKLFVHTLAGALAGLSGLVYVGDLGATSPEMMDLWLFWVFAMAIFGGIAIEGGRGNIENVIAGIFFVSTLDIGARLLGVSVHLVHFVIGILIFIGVIINSIRIRIRDQLLISQSGG